MSDPKPYTLEDLDKELSPYGGARGDALAHYMGDLDPSRVLATVEALERAERERDEETRKRYATEKGLVEMTALALKAERERDEARDLYRETEERLAKERRLHDATEAERERLKAALRRIAALEKVVRGW